MIESDLSSPNESFVLLNTWTQLQSMTYFFYYFFWICFNDYQNTSLKVNFLYNLNLNFYTTFIRFLYVHSYLLMSTQGILCKLHFHPQNIYTALVRRSKGYMRDEFKSELLCKKIGLWAQTQNISLIIKNEKIFFIYILTYFCELAQHLK